jgi:hypothetical protein
VLVSISEPFLSPKKYCQMKKVFIGLLIAAAGAAIYFLLQKKKEPIIHYSIHKEQLIGKWKLDSLLLSKDSDTGFV